MNSDAAQIISRLIGIEENVGKLYRLFATAHSQDRMFWTQLVKEEDNHASLLRTHRDYILESPILHDKLLESSVETLYNINSKIEETIRFCEKQALARIDCFTIAIQIEQSAGELHLQKTISDANPNIAFQVLQTLSAGDHEHAERIKAYMNSQID